MNNFLKRLFGLGLSGPPRLPRAQLEAFRTWYLAQRLPAVALVPDPDGLVGILGSRIGGPAFLARGEAWPLDARGVPLDFLAQLDMADCASLEGYPSQGVIQFFIACDEMFGADFGHPAAGRFLVRWQAEDAPGHLHPQPEIRRGESGRARHCSPFAAGGLRENGLALRPAPFTDKIDWAVIDAATRIDALAQIHDITALETFLEDPANARAMRHHTGGYPAFTQADIRKNPELARYDHVLLHLTSAGDQLRWGDTGEALFMIQKDDLRRGDLARTIYSWDCL